MSTKRLYKKARLANKIIDCEDINKICSLIESPDNSLEEKAKTIKEKLISATLNSDMIPFIENVDNFIIKGKYDNAAKLSNDIWLIYRRAGIGGSDASAILGLSKWNTALGLYYDKIGEKPPEEIDKGKQYIFDFGHAMEEFVAKHYEKVFMSEFKDNVELSFSLQYGEDLKIKECKVYRDTFMYQNPEHPFMRADLDFCIDLTFDNRKTVTGIFECKTTSPFRIKEEWEISPPAYYVCQTRHYMAVMDYPFAIIACAADNSVNNYYSHVIFRNKKIENKIIASEEKFWDYVKSKIPPYEFGVNNKDILLEKTKDLPPNEKKDQSDTIKEIIERYEDISSSLSLMEDEVKRLKKEKEILHSDVLTYMVKSNATNISSKNGNEIYHFSISESISNATDWSKFINLLIKAHPEMTQEIKGLKDECRKSKTPKRSVSIKTEEIFRKE